MSSLIVAPVLELPKFSLSAECESEIEKALGASALIGKVSDEITNGLAVSAAQELKALQNKLEAERLELTAPALKFQRTAKEFVDGKKAELGEEYTRILKLTADYVALNVAKAKDDQLSKDEAATALEREMREAMSQATSHEQREQIEEHYREALAKLAAPPVDAFKTAKGQSLGSDLEITPTDIYAFAKAFPGCVNPPTLKLTETKALIRSGINPVGLTWQEKATVNIRAGRPKTLNVT